MTELVERQQKHAVAAALFARERELLRAGDAWLGELGFRALEGVGAVVSDGGEQLDDVGVADSTRAEAFWVSTNCRMRASAMRMRTAQHLKGGEGRR